MKLFFNPSDDMGPHVNLIYSIVKNISPDVALEIGVRGGVSTKAIMNGMLDSSTPGEYNGCDINKNVKLPEVYNNSILHIMPSDDLSKEWTKKIDVLFIDGSHEYQQVKRDYTNFSKFLSINGIMFLHDTYPPEEKYKSEKLCGTAYKVLEDIRKDDRFECITLPYSFGLTICRRTK